ncbi:olfactory receptor 5P81-like [Engystomops pustulosus]|uniref:olfactory receptor 5P81-like n=1 Tax=Engystomops pustulosus TaxID=76066 RepID=UPI003AFA707D
MTCEANETQVTQIHLLGFRDMYKYKILLFIVFLLTYTLIIGGNLLIILLESSMEHLKTPMFFFLKHLSSADVLLTTTAIPMMLDTVLKEESVISFWGCIVQMHCFGIFGFVQCFIIAVMSFDRYLAICHPLRYSSLMVPNLCLQLVVGSWSLVTVLVSSEMFVVIQFDFCGLNSIDHFFCDFGPVVVLATSDISELIVQDFIIAMFIIFFPFTFIILTYFCIFFTIINIPSTFGKRKAFSTCSSHLTSVCVYYGTLITVYMTPTDESSFDINKYRSLLYIIVTPLMNPIICSLRNNEFKKAMSKVKNHFFPNQW